MESNQNKVRELALVTVLTAVTCVFTLMVRIPTIATEGYIHLGDMMANFAALTFGPWVGLITSGVGMALADVLGGYANWAGPTLLIHGTQGLVAGLIGRSRRPGMMLLGAILGQLVVVGGYFLAEVLIYGLNAALTEIPGNLIQSLAGLIGVPLTMLVLKAYPQVARWTARA